MTRIPYTQQEQTAAVIPGIPGARIYRPPKQPRLACTELLGELKLAKIPRTINDPHNLNRIAAAKKASPDVYFIEGFEPGLAILGQQLRDSGIQNMATIVAFSVSNKPELFEGGFEVLEILERSERWRMGSLACGQTAYRAAGPLQKFDLRQ